jgi:anti-sigma B factor antagonist
MAKPLTALALAVDQQTAFVKVCGRANYNTSTDFKNAINDLHARGLEHFVLDLGDCATMDSTFLGVLAGLALRQADHKPQGDGKALDLELLNPNERVADLLDNLGVGHLFKVLQQPCPCSAPFEPYTPAARPISKEEMCQTSIEAHTTLMDVNPENVDKFKDVTEMMAEDLKRSQQPKQ